MKRLLSIVAFLFIGCAYQHEVVIEDSSSYMTNPACIKLIEDLTAHLEKTSDLFNKLRADVHAAGFQIVSWECENDSKALVLVSLDMKYDQEMDLNKKHCMAKVFARIDLNVVVGRKENGSIDMIDVGSGTIKEIKILDMKCDK